MFFSSNFSENCVYFGSKVADRLKLVSLPQSSITDKHFSGGLKKEWRKFFSLTISAVYLLA